MLFFGPPNVEKLEAKRDVHGLIKALGFKIDGTVRSGAAEALTRIGEPAVAPLIAAYGNKDNNIWVIKGAAEVLAAIGDARAVEPLSAALMHDGDGMLRAHAAEALGKIGAPAVMPLIDAFQHGYGSSRMWVAKALGATSDARAVEPLIAALISGDNPVRAHAAEALGKIGDVRAVEPLIVLLTNELRDWDSKYDQNLGGRETAHMCVVALGKIGDIRAAEPLIQVLANELRDWDSKMSSEYATGSLEIRRMCEETARALEKIGDARAMKVFVDALDASKYDSANLHDTVVEALMKFGAAPKELLITALKNNPRNQGYKYIVKRLLKEIGGQDVEQALAEDATQQ